MPDRIEAAQKGGKRYELRLFVAGDAINSRTALENLKRLLDQAADAAFELEIVDVLQTPQVALDQGVFVTPALQVVNPAPGALIYGNLSNADLMSTLFGEFDR
jgi:circadian clock protein KaiB